MGDNTSMSLFLNTIANDQGGTVTLALPDCKGGIVGIQGYLTEDPRVELKNNWESIISDLGAINDFMQLANIGPASWLSTSKAAWKGTEPIKLGLNFYLITHKKAQLSNGSGLDLPISKQAAHLARLASVAPGGDSGGISSMLKVNVHGGYRPDYFQRNADFAGSNNAASALNSVSDSDFGSDSFASADTGGTVSIVINGGGKRTMRFHKMLLESVNFTTSTVRTGYWNGNVFHTSSEPLYIKVDAQFRLMHAATLADVTRMFTGSDSI